VSVHKNKVGGYDVRYRDASGKNRSKSFRRKRDAERFDLKWKDAKQTGGLAALDGGRETLDAYVEHVWVPVHVAPLAPKTQALYAGLYDGHLAPWLGGYPLCEITSEVIGHWQADRIAAGAPGESTRKALTLLGAILQRAFEAKRISSNPQRLVRKTAPSPTPEVRPLAPLTVEAIRALLRPRDAMVVSILAYSGMRPQELRILSWSHVLERTLVVHAPKTRRYNPHPRSTRLLAPLAQDLREWRLLSGRPDDAAPVIPAHAGGVWTEPGYEQWINHVWAPALKKARIPYQRPYHLLHSFASLLLHEGRSVVYIARQLGQSTAVCMRTYGHVIEELDNAPRIAAEEAILAARCGSDVRTKFGKPD
jgi:integrase